MKCPKCGRQWAVSNKITSTIYVCPYCGETVDGNGHSKKNLGEVIESLIADFGEDVIENTSRLNALLMDYAPDMAKERKLVINALKEGVLTQLRRGLEEHEKTEDIARKCIAMLVSEMWITENAARYAVNVVLRSLGQTVGGEIKPGERNDDSSEDKQLIKGSTSFGIIVSKDDLLGYGSIGYKAFASNDKLMEIDVPENITKIYPKAFLDCTELRKVRLSSKLESIGRGAFDGCIQLEDITIDNNPNYTVSNGLLIEKNRKMLIRSTNRSNTSASVTNGVVSICKKAFEKTNTERINISGTVNEIEEDAFSFTMSLQEIKVDASNRNFKSIDGVLHSRDGKELIRYPQGKKDASYYLEDEVTKIGKKAFSCAVKLCSITFAGNLKEINANAFEYCLGLENLMLPRSVEMIGERAFQYCEKLVSVMLPHGIVRIGDCAFLGCELLKTVSIPSSVKEIGNMAFSGCEALAKVVIQDNVRFIGDKAFSDCPNIEVSVTGNDYVSTYCKMHGIKWTKV
jgi:hypothetical protein